ncbi:MAG: nucleotidyltransferase family protein [Clostridiales bacterium]|nr:nucleotidyltransferase family protein [Clostridiales bacterium]
MKLCCVVTAAGAGKRFGGNKLLHPVAGRPMLAHVLRAMPPVCRFSVLPQGDERLAALATAYGFETVFATEPGMSGSVRAGLAAACASGEPDGILFAVGDQPRLTRASVERLCDMFAANPQRIVALAAGGQRGNPVIFPRHTFVDLANLTGDKGGSQVIAKYPDLLLLCEAGAAEELTDIDRKDELL